MTLVAWVNVLRGGPAGELGRWACRKSPGRNRVEFKRDMSDDLAISDFADQLHDDLLVKRLTDSDNTGFSNDLEKGASVDEVPKTASGGFFYSLVGWIPENTRFFIFLEI